MFSGRGVQEILQKVCSRVLYRVYCNVLAVTASSVAVCVCSCVNCQRQGKSRRITAALAASAKINLRLFKVRISHCVVSSVAANTCGWPNKSIIFASWSLSVIITKELKVTEKLTKSIINKQTKINTVSS